MSLFLRLIRLELGYLLAALFLSVFVITAFSAFTERLQIMLLGETSQLLAADTILKSPYLLDDDLLLLAQAKDLQTTRFASFQSMVFVDDQPQLVNVKAVDDGYPLKGLLEIEQADGQRTKQSEGPRPSEIWAEKRLFTLLDLSFGQAVFLGDSEFTVTQTLIHQPDQGMNLFSVGPVVLMHWSDVERTGLIQLGSKVSYSYLFAGDKQTLQTYRTLIQERLTDSQEWLDLENAQPTVANIVQSAQLFFLLASGAVVILSSIALAMAARRFAEQHKNTVAILKSFGLTSRRISRIYTGALLLYSLPVYCLASVLAFFAQDAVLKILAEQMLVAVPTLSVWPFVLGFFTAGLSLLAFVGPALWQLKNTSALAVLKQDDFVLSHSLWSLLFGGTALFALLWVYSGNLLLTGLVFFALVLLFLLLFALFYGVINRLLSKPLVLNHWRFLAINQLKAFLPQHALQAAIFSVSLMLLVLIIGLQHHLFSEWKKQLPEDAPNTFLVNIYQEHLAELQTWLADNHLSTELIYPMVRGRLIKINDDVLHDTLDKEQLKKAGVDRELNLSWAKQMPVDNKLVEGEWRKTNQGVSVEEKLATRLNIKLGDHLTFRINAQEVSAEVSSIRSLDWNTMRPNFFMLLDESLLESHPRTYLTSARILPEQKPLMTELVQRWPSIILIEIDSVIQQVRTIVSYIGLALQIVLLFIVVASLLVLVLTVQDSLQVRRSNNALLRVFGVGKALLQRSLLAEFVLLGVIAGAIAALIAQIALLVIQVWLFNMPFSLQWSLLPLAPLVGALLIGAAGFISASAVAKTPPAQLLK